MYLDGLKIFVSGDQFVIIHERYHTPILTCNFLIILENFVYTNIIFQTLFTKQKVLILFHTSCR
jgi:hypothetical protein